jgi:hypothetical protein
VVQPLSRLTALVAISGLIAACGHREATRHRDDAAAGSAVQTATIVDVPIGVDRIARFNFIYGDGAAAYAKALGAAKAKDWATVRADCEAALAKDAAHLDAEYLLGVALAQTGDVDGASKHLAAALGADYFGYADKLATDDDLAAFRATPIGKATSEHTKITAEVARIAKDGLWLVGRRSPFKWPAKDGVQPGTSRGELYAYDRASQRYVRLTHTDHQVAGFVRAPGGGEVALLGFDKVDHEADKPPGIARGWLVAVDAATWKPLGKRITLPPSRAISAGYGDGDQLLAATRGNADWTVSSVDRSTGKLAKVAQPLPAPRVEVALDGGRGVTAAQLAGVEATWTDGAAPSLKLGATTIDAPESGKVAHDTVAVAPGGASVAFATAVDPCAKDTLPSLYVGDAKTGALRHVLTAKSRFATRWLDPTTLAYDDGDGAIRLWDVATGRETARLDNKPGLALDVLAAGTATCAPPTTEKAGSGDELPPEDVGSGSGTK